MFQFLELLLATFHGEVLSLIQAVLQVLNCDLQVLLHPLQVRTGSIIKVQLGILTAKGIFPAPDLSIKSALHGVNHPLAVSLDLFHFLVLLSNLPVNLTLDLVELKLDTNNLSLLVLQSAL
uniref:Secreted protein n=1 Tax=Nothobranchius furzeri TaxID=105023 RepID=A0A8C6KXL9_NOTFU